MKIEVHEASFSLFYNYRHICDSKFRLSKDYFLNSAAY